LATHSRGFEEEVERVLKQVFFLDCITRTEGFYPVNLHERNAIEDQVDLNFEYLYDQPTGQRLRKYLEVPFSILKPHLPQWKLTANIISTPANVEIIPFLVNDLAIIRPANRDEVFKSQSLNRYTDEFTRSCSLIRSSGVRSRSGETNHPDVVDLKESDSLEQTWVGDGVPMGASKAVIDAFFNRLNRTPIEGDIEITVICNDPEMSAERDIVGKIYGSRETLPFDVELFKEIPKKQLKDILESDIDFLHYIGHIDDNGFECDDGYFDAGDLENSGVDAFFLNACSSYRQGEKLLKAGSICGIVTLQEVINSGAERIGETLAKLLNCGYPFRSAVNIAKNRSIMGGHYIVLGDGSLDIVQSQSGNPVYCKLNKKNDDYYLTYLTFPARGGELGAIHYPYLVPNDEFYLISGKADKFEINKNNLIRFVKSENIPIEVNGELKWSSEIDYDTEL